MLLHLFSIIEQWGYYKYVLSKKIKTDISNKSAFAITLFLLPSKRVPTSISLLPFVIIQQLLFSTKGQNSIRVFFDSQISLICLIYLSLPNLYFYIIQSMTKFLKILNKVNLRALANLNCLLLTYSCLQNSWNY